MSQQAKAQGEWKAQKKAYRKAKRKYVQPWKLLAILLIIPALLVQAVGMVVNMADNTIAIVAGDNFWTLKNEDTSAVYYSGDYTTTEERLAAGADVVYQTEAEGAVLLKNDNGSLPLAEGARISLFSNSSVNVVYGGTGSANVDSSTADNLKQAAEKSGFAVNDVLWNFYAEGPGSEYVRVEGGLFSSEKTATVEVPWSVYTDEVKNSFAQYGDAAVIVLSRVGGEDDDLEYASYNYLELDPVEREMLEQVKKLKDEGVFQTVVMLVNTSNALQMDFLTDNPYGIDAMLWTGGVGQSGLNAVCDILAGKVNPSGSLVATYCYDNYSSPAMVNFAPMEWGGFADSGLGSTAQYYMIYQEGIYVGYKYYETRYEDVVMGTGNTSGYEYGADVAFPFGYGLSYSTFALSDFNASYNAGEDTFQVSVKVSNTGDAAGKKTVQIYGQSPYTEYDKQNGVEKAAVQLVGFAKTGELAPGASETLTVTVPRRELASYDTNGKGTYILEDGTYYLTAAHNAHDAVNHILAAKGFSKADGMDADGDAGLTFEYVNDTFDAKTYAVSDNGTEIVNQASDADLNYYGGAGVEVTYLSRSDWAGTFPQEAIQIQLNDQLIRDLDPKLYDRQEREAGAMPVLGADNGLKLYDMMGLDYDDPKWEQLLDQLTFEEMAELIGDAFHWTMPVESINAPGTRNENGPQGLTARLFPIGPKFATVALTSEDVMAATFNRELAYANGKVVGNDCVDNNVAVLYGPGNNIHRTPYSGRNFEYYSEDGFLSGQITRQEVQGVQDMGAQVTMKHFALNDHENARVGISIWANEQSIREVYLKAFQPAFEAESASGVMTSYTRWGTTWAGAHEGLITGILRGEWGCQGIVLSDNCRNHMDAISGVAAGSSAYDDMMGGKEGDLLAYKNDPTAAALMREACHHNLYTIVNSLGMNGVGPGTTVKAKDPGFATTVRVLRVLLPLLFLVCLGLYTWGRVRFSKTEACQTYRAQKKARKNQ